MHLPNATRVGPGIVFGVTPEEFKLYKVNEENKKLQKRLDRMEDLINKLVPDGTRKS